MNKLLFGAAIGTSLALIPGAKASLLFSDGFNYTQGTDLGAGDTTPPWTLGATATSSMSIGSSDLTYSGSTLEDLGGNDLILNSGGGTGVPAYASLTGAPITSGSIYFSFLIDCTSLPTSNSYLAALTPSSKLTPNGNTTDAIDVYAKNSGSGWELGVRTTGVSASYESTVLSAGTVYYAVYEYTFNGTTPTASLWLDPATGGSQTAATVSLTGAGSVTDVSAFGFKSQATSAVGNFDLDNVLVGTTWADVTPTPEPSTLALAGLGAVGIGLLRRKSR